MQAINGKMYVMNQPGDTPLYRELPPEELVVLMLNSDTEVYGGNNGLQTLAILTDHNFATR